MTNRILPALFLLSGCFGGDGETVSRNASMYRYEAECIGDGVDTASSYVGPIIANIAEEAGLLMVELCEVVSGLDTADNGGTTAEVSMCRPTLEWVRIGDELEVDCFPPSHVVVRYVGP